MSRLWLAALLLILSITGALALAQNETEKEQQEPVRDNSSARDKVAQQIPPQHLANEIDTHWCQPDMCAFLRELAAMQTRQEAAERHVQELKTQNAAQGLEIQALRHRSDSTDTELRGHRRQLEELGRAKPRVAFAAALGDGRWGPSNAEHTLVFQKILTNVGNAYNPSTGVFVVPVRGVYYVSFSTFTFDNGNSNACVSLYRNKQLLLTACDHGSVDSSDSASNGATLLLEMGDHVYVTLHARSTVYDDFHNRSCFRGFLLFQM